MSGKKKSKNNAGSDEIDIKINTDPKHPVNIDPNRLKNKGDAKTFKKI